MIHYEGKIIHKKESVPDFLTVDMIIAAFQFSYNNK